GWDARKRAYCLKIQPATGSFARNLIYSTKPVLPYVAPILSLTVTYAGGDKEVTLLPEDSEWRVGYRMEVWF
ncbi:hypothetical protein M1V68_21375, partial [Klebsiella pneumoniae]|nr:hypothetical protein [Klebsiella pneumoniae]